MFLMEFLYERPDFVQSVWSLPVYALEWEGCGEFERRGGFEVVFVLSGEGFALRGCGLVGHIGVHRGRSSTHDEALQLCQMSVLANLVTMSFYRSARWKSSCLKIQNLSSTSTLTYSIGRTVDKHAQIFHERLK